MAEFEVAVLAGGMEVVLVEVTGEVLVEAIEVGVLEGSTGTDIVAITEEVLAEAIEVGVLEGSTVVDLAVAMGALTEGGILDQGMLEYPVELAFS
ncbi:hypothetical protein [Methylobacter sp.]|uniref:hypothetical protein n=1 Tax=Methylobacter sp. TaxID=2051955 RepID=UPI003DA23F24